MFHFIFIHIWDNPSRWLKPPSSFILIIWIQIWVGNTSRSHPSVLRSVVSVYISNLFLAGKTHVPGNFPLKSILIQSWFNMQFSMHNPQTYSLLRHTINHSVKQALLKLLDLYNLIMSNEHALDIVNQPYCCSTYSFAWPSNHQTLEIIPYPNPNLFPSNS